MFSVFAWGPVIASKPEAVKIFNKSRSILCAAFIVFVLSGCAVQGLETGRYATAEASPNSFGICHNYGCALRSRTSYSEQEWADIQEFFDPPAQNAEAERQQIAKAIARMELYTGQKVGTDTDIAAATFHRADDRQMDCIDETINTDQYLKFLQRDGLLRWHTVDKPIRRGYFLDLTWPHNTATVKDMQTGQIWTVDSWYRANGEDPYIIKAETWLAGWHPPEER